MLTHVMVSFGDGSYSYFGDGSYSYFNHVEDLQVGDIVLVPSGNRFAIGKVIAEAKTDHEKARATKWVVARIDMEKWEALTALKPPPVVVTSHTGMVQKLLKIPLKKGT